MASENGIHMVGTLGVGMIAQRALSHAYADLLGAGCRDLAQQRNDLLRAAGDEDLAIRGEETVDAGPRISNETRAGASGFKDTRGWGETDLGHGVAIDVEHHAGRRIHRIVIAGADMSDPTDVGGKLLAFPT